MGLETLRKVGALREVGVVTVHACPQEWTNAIFLMLNVAAGNGYGNSFIETDGGKARVRPRPSPAARGRPGGARPEHREPLGWGSLGGALWPAHGALAHARGARAGDRG